MSEAYKWVFVGEIPLLCEARNVARQLEIEIWLDPEPLFSALNLKPLRQQKPNVPKYVA